jgi:muramoyltetrapeptide carboxypeptidase
MKPLCARSTIAVVAPASLPREGDLDAGRALLARIGLRCEFLGIDARHAARTREGDRLRAACLNEAFARPDIDAIVCMRGGYGSGRIVEHLDLAGIAANPKIFLGYSDITHLLFALRTMAGLHGFHGPVLTDLACNRDAAAVRACFEVLTGTRSGYTLPLEAMQCLRAGAVTGPLLGGNLAVLSAMTGSPELRIDDGAILFFEDVNEFMYQMDRYLSQFRRCGLLERVAGIMVGKNVIKDPQEGNSLGLGFEAMLREHLRDFDGPVVCDIPLGHTQDQITLPFGATTTMQVTGGELDLAFEPAFAAPSPKAGEFIAAMMSAAVAKVDTG